MLYLTSLVTALTLSPLQAPGAAMPQLQRASAVSMMADQDATRDSSSQSFDNGMAGWKPPGGGGGGDAHGGAGFESTDTPDFLPEEGSEAAALAGGVGFTDGMYGSQADPNRKKSTGPELQGALDSNPDIYYTEEEGPTVEAGMFVLPPESFKVTKMEMSQTDEDFDMFCASTCDKDLVIEVKPVCMTFQNYVAGFTADSHPAFSVSPASGKMERRNGPKTELVITCNPQGSSGQLVGYLCVILPDEKDFSSYYKITCDSQ